MTSLPTRLLASTLLMTALASPTSALAVNGAPLTAGPSYYEAAVASVTAAELNSTSAQPASLGISDSDASASYVLDQIVKDRAEWTLKVRGLQRNHVKVDAVFQMIAVLPLPVSAAGKPDFKPLQWGIQPRAGTESSSVPLTYSGEAVTLKRNVFLERTLLPNLIGASSGQLPDLSGTGYDYTLWDTIVRYDASYGDSIEVLADLRFSTDLGVAAPDATDPRLGAYVITWIPAFNAQSIPPYAIHIDVVDPPERVVGDPQ